MNPSRKNRYPLTKKKKFNEMRAQGLSLQSSARALIDVLFRMKPGRIKDSDAYRLAKTLNGSLKKIPRPRLRGGGGAGGQGVYQASGQPGR